jgi:hypothetical protein
VAQMIEHLQPELKAQHCQNKILTVEQKIHNGQIIFFSKSEPEIHSENYSSIKLMPTFSIILGCFRTDGFTH